MWGPRSEIFFTKISAYNAPQGHISLAIFTKFLPFVGSFMFGQVLKFGRIWSRDLGVLGFKYRGVHVTPN